MPDVSADRVMRATVTYSLFDFHMSNTYYARVANVPTPTMCRNFADAIQLWDANTLAFLRGFDSILRNIRVVSLDPASKAMYLTPEIFGRGFILTVLSRTLPNHTAPIVYWRTTPQRRRRGRTYVCGMTEGLLGAGGDSNHVGLFFRTALITVFSDLNPIIQGHGAGIQVLLQTRALRAPLVPAPSFPVSGVEMDDGALGTQDRRFRVGDKFHLAGS